MADLFEDKPYPENRSPEKGSPKNKPVEPKKGRSMFWNILLLIALVALLVWIFMFLL